MFAKMRPWRPDWTTLRLDYMWLAPPPWADRILLLPAMEEWLADNFADDAWWFTVNPAALRSSIKFDIGFCNDADAALFRLRWC